MGFYGGFMNPSFWNAKRIIIALIVLLIGCDVTLLFAAQADADNTIPSQQQKQLQQIQRLQQPTVAVTPQAPLVNSLVPTASPPPVNQPTTPAVANVVNSVSSTPGQVALTAAPISAVPQPAAASAPAPTTAPGMVSTEDLNNSAFNAVAQNALPMSPEQIQRLKQLFNQTQYAAAANVGAPPKPTATSQFVNLAPGSTPPVIRLAQGFISSLVFIDSSGAPWPIEAYDIGNPTAFNIQWNKSDNTLMIQATTLYTYGNLAVRLQGLPTPVMLTLVPGQKAVDYRVDLRIQGYGPNAKAVSTGLPNSTNPELLGVLDGVPPSGSTSLRVVGGPADAWSKGDKMFVRTRFTILSPGWIATMSSADGTKAYEMPKAPLLLVSQNGKIIQFKIEGL